MAKKRFVCKAIRGHFRIFSIFFLNLLILIPFNAGILAYGQEGVFRGSLSKDKGTVEIAGHAEEFLVKIKGDSEIRRADGDLLGQWQSDPSMEIEYFEPDYTYRASYVPNDAKYGEQWTLSKIKAPQAWDLTKGSPEVIIAILDSGVDADHPDLKDNIWTNGGEIPGNGIDDDRDGYVDDVYGWDFVSESPDPSPKINSSIPSSEQLAGLDHGTIVAGIAAAVGDNSQGIAGVSLKSKIMPLRVLNSVGEGSTGSVIKAIDFAIAHHADVINMSFVGSSRSEFLEQAIKRAWDAGIVLVAAAGKDSAHSAESGENLDQFPAYPVCQDGSDNMVIGVAATDNNDKKASFSNYSENYIDISAPGTKFYSTLFYQPSDVDFKDYYGGYWSGTSVSAPLVSGVAALVKSINPALTNGQIRDMILTYSDNIEAVNPDYRGKLGKGRLNAYEAVKAAYLNMGASTLPSSAMNIIVGAGNGGGPHVRTLRPDSYYISGFFAYDPKFRGGVNMAVGDVNGDGKDEIVAGAGNGGGPHIRIFDSEGHLKGQFFAYDPKFRGGVNVAVGDLDGDGQDEIVAGAGNGGGPHVRIFDSAGRLKGQFFAYDPNFRGGVNVAVGDLDGDGLGEIIASPAAKGGPQVRIFDSAGNVKSQFFAYDPKFRGGLKAAVGDVDGDGAQDVAMVISTKGQAPEVRIFSMLGELEYHIMAYDESFLGGINIALADIDGDGSDDLVVGPASDSEPQVRIMDRMGNLKSQFMAYAQTFRGGVNVAVIRK